MCVYSAVMDTWTDKIPTIIPWEVPNIPTTIMPTPSKSEIIEIRKFIETFKAEVEKAKEQDIKENNPDCADPEKAKLEDRVRELEALLNSNPEFVLVKRTNLQPGKYRVINGELHKIYE